MAINSREVYILENGKYIHIALSVPATVTKPLNLTLSSADNRRAHVNNIAYKHTPS